MQFPQPRPVSGDVFPVDWKSGPVCRAGRPAGGFVTKRTAEAWLRDVPAHASAGTLPGMAPSGLTLERAPAARRTRKPHVCL